MFGKRVGGESGAHVKIKFIYYNKDVLRDRKRHDKG